MSKKRWSKKSIKKKDSKETKNWSKCLKNIDRSNSKYKSKNNKSSDNKLESKKKIRRDERSMRNKSRKKWINIWKKRKLTKIKNNRKLRRKNKNN